MENQYTQNYSVEIIRSEDEDSLVGERWRDENGKLHREFGPAVINYFADTGAVKELYHYRHGVLGADNTRTYARFNKESGALVEESWFKNNVPHNEDGQPARILYDPTGKSVLQTEFYVNGNMHRSDGPALVKRDAETGVKTLEGYWVNGKKHRDQGFAWIERSPEGEMLEGKNFVNGQPVINNDLE